MLDDVRASLLAFALFACARPIEAPIDAASADVGLPLTTDQLDLLFLIDDSSSMTEEQAALAAVIPSLLTALVTGDRDGDGDVDFTPVRSLHVGIVGSDMGLGEASLVGSCRGIGDDGVLRVETSATAAGCAASYASTYPDRVFAFDGSASTDTLAHDVACMASLGTDGCGIEFELEAPYAALVRHGSDPATNGAFLRPDSVLAIVTLNDEDDCSTGNLAIYSDDARYSSVDFDLRCHFFASELHPIARYVDGFAGLRADPRRLVYATITGVPVGASGLSPTTVLADPAMMFRVDPDTHHVLPACTSADGSGVAFAGVRMTRVAEGLAALGAYVTVQSICAPSFEPARDAILDQIAAALN